MKTPFLWLALGFLFGIIAERSGFFSTMTVASALAGGIFLLWFLRGRRGFFPFFLLVTACAGFLWARIDARVPEDAVQCFAGPDRIILRGVVDSLPEVKTRGKKVTISLVLRAGSITQIEKGKKKSRKVSGKVQVFMLQAPEAPQAGDTIRLFGVLNAPRQVLNPGEFDHAGFLAQKNIFAIFQTIGKKSVRIVQKGPAYSPLKWLVQTRKHLATLIEKLYTRSEASILKALVLGVRSDVAPEVRNQFMKTGTIHLLAISGLNITMIAGTFYLIFLFAGLGYRGTSLLTILIVTLYIGLAGAGIPVQRAGYGAILVLAGVLIRRPSNLLNALCFACWLILLCNPKSIWNIGFQLSFLSVLSLILVLPLLTRFNAWTLSLGSSLAVLFGTFPLVLFYFNIFSPVGILANLAAIPLFDAALFTTLLSLIFCGVPLLNVLWVRISSSILGAGLAWVQALASWSGGYWFFKRPLPVFLLAYYVCLALVLICHKKMFRGKPFVMAMLLIGWAASSTLLFVDPEGSGFEVNILASGRSQIMTARFSNGACWLLNAGKNFPSDQGEWLVAPFLRHRGVQRLEGVLLTDLSRKHTGGLMSVLRDFPVRHLLYPEGSFYGPEGLLRLFFKLGHKLKTFGRGSSARMENESIRVLARSSRGTALLIASGPWRLLMISRWDPELFTGLLSEPEKTGEVHAVFLPALDRAIPDEFGRWLDLCRPLLAVFFDPEPALKILVTGRRVRYLDLKRAGALVFKRAGSRLELSSFVKGPLGFYAYV